MRLEVLSTDLNLETIQPPRFFWLILGKPKEDRDEDHSAPPQK